MVGKRRSVLDSGNYHVWSITWKDLVRDNAEHNMVCHTPVADMFRQYAAAARGQGKTVPDPAKMLRGGFEQLLAFIETPHAAGWTQLATSANAYYLQQLTSRRTVSPSDLQTALADWRSSGAIAQLPHAEGGSWVHNERASLTSDFITYMKVDDALTNRLSKAIMIARLGDGEAEVTGSDFEERWRRFLSCMNIYQFLGHFHFWSSSEIAQNLASEIPFEVAESISPEWKEVRDDVTASLRHYVDDLAAAGLPLPEALPEVEHYNDEIDDDAFAEMAWPNLTPPIAVLAGDQEAFSKQWQDSGWKVFTPDSLQASGISALVDRLTQIQHTGA